MAVGVSRLIPWPAITEWKSQFGFILIFLVHISIGYEEEFQISLISPKSAVLNNNAEKLIQETILENTKLKPSPKVDSKNSNDVDSYEQIEKTRNIDRPTRSINIDEISATHNLFDDIDSNDVEIHHKRKYFDHIQPTKRLSETNDDEDILILSSKGFGDKIDFFESGEYQGVPRARALPLPGPQTPIHATIVPDIGDSRQNNGDILEIITGLQNILKGNVNVQANTQQPARHTRPMASRINNRGPPRISDLPPLPDFDSVINTLPPTKIPPPYPFDRPALHETPPKLENPIRPYLTGVNLPEQIVPVSSGRPGYGRPPWVRPRPRPYPSRRPGQGFYKPTIPYLQHEVTVTSTEVTTTSEKDAEVNIIADVKDNTTNEIKPDKSEVMVDNVTEVLATENATTVKDANVTTTTEKPNKAEINKETTKKKETFEKEKNKVKIEKTTETINLNLTDVIDTNIVEPSTTVIIESTSHAATPLEGLPDRSVAVEEKINASSVVESINTLPTTVPPSTKPSYKPRPGIVLDDPDFKPHKHAQEVITASSPIRPAHGNNYGEIFDVTVSAIQGPGHRGGASVHVQNVNPLTGLEDDIIVSASGDQGFVSIDGKRTYLNLFGETNVPVNPTPVQGVAATKPPPSHMTTPTPSVIGSKHNRPGASRPTQAVHGLRRTQPPLRRPAPTVRIDTCIVGDDSTCDQTQNEKCKTEFGISSCHCRPGYARRVLREPCRRVSAFMISLRVDKVYERKMVWDNKLADRESDVYQQLSYEAIKAIDSAFSMTPYSDDFVSGVVNNVYKMESNNMNGVFVNYTVLMEESAEALRPSIAGEIHKHILGVIRRRSNNIGDSALWVDSPAGSVSGIQDLDECSTADLNDCHKMALCINTWGGFRCECLPSTRDAAPTKPGRDCQQCPDSHCNNRGSCQYIETVPYCSCQSGYYGSRCEVDGEVVGVAVGASLTALLVILLTLMALVTWSRKWSRDQKIANGMGSPVFMSSTLKAPVVGQPPYQVSLEERIRWAQIAEAMAHNNHYNQSEAVQTMGTRPSSALFTNYPQISGTLPPVPMPRLGLHMGSTLRHNGAMNTLASRINTSQGNLYGYMAHQAESTSSEGDCHVQDRVDLLGPQAQPRNMHVPRPKSTTNQSVANQSGIYYDVDYENAPEPIYGSKGIPLSTYTISRIGPPYYRA